MLEQVKNAVEVRFKLSENVVFLELCLQDGQWEELYVMIWGGPMVQYVSRCLLDLKLIKIDAQILQ